jgi:predicted transcriptional regulator
MVWFSSREVQYVYEQELREPINLSTIATYLSRLTVKGSVMKTGMANRLKYKLTPILAQATVNHKGA